MEGGRREGHVEEGDQGGGGRYGEIAPGWLRSWSFRKHVVVFRNEEGLFGGTDGTESEETEKIYAIQTSFLMPHKKTSFHTIFTLPPGAPPLPLQPPSFSPIHHPSGPYLV